MPIKSYPDEFKIEAVRQVTDCGYKPKDAAKAQVKQFINTLQNTNNRPIQPVNARVIID